MNYRTLSIALHPAFQAQLRAVACRRAMTVSEYVRRLVRRDLATRATGTAKAPLGGQPPPALPHLPPAGQPPHADPG